MSGIADSLREISNGRNRESESLVRERIISGRCEPLAALLPKVALRVFASAQCGATAMSTGTATFEPGARRE